MNRLRSILVCIAVSTAAAAAAADGTDAEASSRSLLRRPDDLAVVIARKEAHRDDSIRELAATEDFDQEDRSLAKDCGSNKRYFRLDLRTDSYGFENKWEIRKRQNGSWVQIESGPPRNTKYGANNVYAGGFCLSAGNYKFIITDLFKDGMCCSFGNGSYRGYIDGRKKFEQTDDSDWTKKSHAFQISVPSSSNNNAVSNNVLPFKPKMDMSDRDTQWLDSHNTRRKKYHQRYGKSYRPLKWSNALKEESEKYAKKLLKNGCSSSLLHDKNNPHGENLAAHGGTGSWAKERAPDTILERWVEKEEDDPWPQNGHMTAALWRATEYVGCGEASAPRSGGGMCHRQVCRYARPGNCNMGAYKSNKRDWWKTPMLMDESGCTPKCPPDGCQ